MSFIKALVTTILKYVSPFFALMVPAIMLYGFAFPWAPAQNALSKYEHGIAILVGVHYHASGDIETRRNTYLIIRSKPLSSLTMGITVVSDGSDEVNEHEGGLVGALISYLFIVFCTWWFWFRGKPHNKSLQPTDSVGG